MELDWEPVTTAELQALSGRLTRHPEQTIPLDEALRTLVDQASYRDWFAKERLAAQPYRGQIPNCFKQLGLAQGGVLRLQGHRALGAHFLTDSPAVDKKIRVYPYNDETLRVHECAAVNGLYDWANLVIDLACGCGHHAILWPNSGARRYLFDISERALTYAAINAQLNFVDPTAVVANDVKNGVPAWLRRRPGDKTVFLVNMPFGLSPLPGILPLTSDGGQTGATFTFKALEAIHSYWKRTGGPVKAVVLCYTVGQSASGPWEVATHAQRLFGSANVQFDLLTDERMVRINGEKQLPVPVTTTQFAQRAECRLDVLDADRESFRNGYRHLIETLDAGGWDHVGYGTLFLNLPERR